jgi:hypothetical protein
MHMRKPRQIVDAIEQRHMAACALEQSVDRSKISHVLRRFAAVTDAPSDIRFVEAEAAALTAARAAASVHTRWSDLYRQAASLAFAVPNDNLARTDRLVPALRAARIAWGESARWDQLRAEIQSTMWELPSLSVAAIGAAARGDIPAKCRWQLLLEALEAGCFSFWIGGAAIHAAERPGVLLDDAGRLHSARGPAYAWFNNVRGYYWHGVDVPAFAIVRPERITVDMINTVLEARLQRVMIERYRCGEPVDGPAAYMRDAGGRVLDRDDRYGILWCCVATCLEPLVMIEVVNTTPGPDWWFKHRWLRVPSTITSARDAVAWAHAARTTEYSPRIGA